MTYLAFFVFALGIVVQSCRILAGYRVSKRYAIGPRREPAFLGALYETFLARSIMKASPVFYFFLLVFHICFFLLILGHLELIGEIGILQIIEHDIFLGGGVIGIALFICVLFFLFRRFHSPTREISAIDYYVLIILILAIIFGSQLHLARRIFTYRYVNPTHYQEYLSSLFSFAPELPRQLTGTARFGGHSLLLVLHVFFANLFLMLVPFTKIMHFILSFPLKRLQRK